jgi:hypothetical protein
MLPKASNAHCQAVGLQPMREDVLLLCGLEAAQEDVCGDRPGLKMSVEKCL